MGSSNHRSRPVAAPNDIYRAFANLDRSDRRRVALRILANQQLVGDLYDHFLIQRSLREDGQSISWKERRRSAKAAAC